MNLGQLLALLDELDDDLTIYVDGSSDLGCASRSVAALEPDDGSLPPGAEGMKNLLDVRLVKDLLEVWSEWRDGAAPTTEDQCKAVLHDADKDAYLPAS